MFSFFFDEIILFSLVLIVLATFLVKSSLFESFEVVELLIDVFKLGFFLIFFKTRILSLSLLSSDSNSFCIFFLFTGFVFLSIGIAF